MSDYNNIMINLLSFNSIENNISFLSDEIKGQPLDLLGKTSTLMNLLPTKVSLIDNSPLEGGPKVTGIEYSISVKSNINELSRIKSLNYSNNSINDLSSSLLLISSWDTNYQVINKLLNNNNQLIIEELTNAKKYVKDQILLQDCVNKLFQELAVNNLNSIIQDHDNQVFRRTHYWEDYLNGKVRFKLDKKIICKKTFGNVNAHQYSLSERNLNRPYELNEATCKECGSKMFILPPKPIINPSNKKENDLDNIEVDAPDQLKYVIKNSFELGYSSVNMINLLFEEKNKEPLNNNLLVLPKIIHYSWNRNEYQIVFNEVKEHQYKITLGRDYFNWLNFKIQKSKDL